MFEHGECRSGEVYVPSPMEVGYICEAATTPDWQLQVDATWAAYYHAIALGARARGGRQGGVEAGMGYAVRGLEYSAAAVRAYVCGGDGGSVVSGVGKVSGGVAEVAGVESEQSDGRVVSDERGCVGQFVGRVDRKPVDARPGALESVVGRLEPVVGRVEVVSEKTLANRAKRARKAAAKRVRREAAGKLAEARAGERAKSEVPEWRRKGPERVTPKFTSVFEGCDEEKRKQLRETQLDMLIAKNKFETEKCNRYGVNTSKYAYKNQLEDLVRQAELEAKLEAVAKQRHIQGWAETVMSNPDSISSRASTFKRLVESGLITPNSSVSAEAAEAKMEAAIQERVSAEVTLAMEKRFRDLELVMRGYTQ